MSLGPFQILVILLVLVILFGGVKTIRRQLTDDNDPTPADAVAESTDATNV